VIELEHSATLRKAVFTVFLALFITASLAKLNLSAKAQPFPEYEAYVHTYVNSTSGNWTYLEKPSFPVHFNDSQIAVGENWSIVCPLEGNHSYHIYFYGEWINNGSSPKTDYDIYVYNSLGDMEGYHTEAAGFPEHLGTSVEDPFFVPRLSGNYTFVIVNDPRESMGAEPATFMLIEDVDCNAWHEHFVEGKGNDSLPAFRTSWAYEFVTEKQYVEAWVKVPETLDMYEARVYMMSNPLSANATILNGVPLAWESGLFGTRTGLLGGYNLDSGEDRGLAYATCEFYGQNMFLNFTSPYVGKSVYHLVLIGEAGAGVVDFLVKTEFNNTRLLRVTVPARAFPWNDTVITYSSLATDLENATLTYSVNGDQNGTFVQMDIVDNDTCTAVIPGHAAGTLVKFWVEADDVLENILVVNGSYFVKHPSTLNISLAHDTVRLGENITVNGCMTPATDDAQVIVRFTSLNETREMVCFALEDGTFAASFRPETIGEWSVQARFEGDAYVFVGESEWLTVKVEEQPFFVKYSLYIGGGLGAAALVGVVVYFKKSKG
jgi:hypothetical protein